ncbi:hypothetical protein JVU11DRAFT_12149 [Chiua virens]|nr:hypothetical protein JVU11DRAFT_12149 [Chiua virens]
MLNRNIDVVNLFNGGDRNPRDDHADSWSDEEPHSEAMPIDDVPTTRNKPGAKKSRVISMQPPASPTRPSTKRIAPTSPTSPKRAPPKGKKQKQISEGALTSKGKGKANERPEQTVIRAVTPVPFAIGLSAGPSSASAPAPALSISAPLVSSSSLPTKDVDMADATHEAWDPETDPILRQIRADPDWEKDPDELMEMATLQLSGLTDVPALSQAPIRPSSPLSSPPSSPAQQRMPSISSGIKPRAVAATPTPSGSSNPRSVEKVGGLPLVPVASARFKAPGPNRGKGKSKGKRGGDTSSTK